MTSRFRGSSRVVPQSSFRYPQGQTGPAAESIFQQMLTLHYRFRLGSHWVFGWRKDVARSVELTGGPQKSEERARPTMSRPRRKQFRGVGAGKPRREAF